MSRLTTLQEICTGFTFGNQAHRLVLDALGQREANLGVVELLNLGPPRIPSLDLLHFDDLQLNSQS